MIGIILKACLPSSFFENGFQYLAPLILLFENVNIKVYCHRSNIGANSTFRSIIIINLFGVLLPLIGYREDLLDLSSNILLINLLRGANSFYNFYNYGKTAKNTLELKWIMIGESLAEIGNNLFQIYGHVGFKIDSSSLLIALLPTIAQIFKLAMLKVDISMRLDRRDLNLLFTSFRLVALPRISIAVMDAVYSTHAESQPIRDSFGTSLTIVLSTLAFYNYLRFTEGYKEKIGIDPRKIKINEVITATTKIDTRVISNYINKLGSNDIQLAVDKFSGGIYGRLVYKVDNSIGSDYSSNGYYLLDALALTMKEAMILKFKKKL